MVRPPRLSQSTNATALAGAGILLAQRTTVLLRHTFRRTLRPGGTLAVVALISLEPAAARVLLSLYEAVRAALL
jgi:hypothetical protein